MLHAFGQDDQAIGQDGAAKVSFGICHHWFDFDCRPIGYRAGNLQAKLESYWVVSACL
jgi:hypothetical protein